MWVVDRMPQSVELTYGAQDKDPEGDVEWESQSNGWISTGGGLDLAWIELDNKGKRVPRVFLYVLADNEAEKMFLLL